MLRIFIEKDYLKDRVIIDTKGCWQWQAGKTTAGYGSIRKNSTHFLAHRASYQAFNGDIGDFHVLHKCDTPSCINPDHLFLGTNQDNIADSMAKGRRKGVTRNRPKGIKYNPQSIESRMRMSKLSKLDIRNCISLNSMGVSIRSIGRLYGVAGNTVANSIERYAEC